MPIAMLLLGLVVQGLGRTSLETQDIERRTEALNNGQIGLERMTSEIRQAEWIYFRSSSHFDMLVPVRATPTSTAAPRTVRYDCTGETCVRWEGAATNFPPPAVPVFTKSETVIGSPASEKGIHYGLIVGHDVFYPRRVDPATGAATADFLNPDFLVVRLRLEVEGRGEMILLEDGISLRNRSSYTG